MPSPGTPTACTGAASDWSAQPSGRILNDVSPSAVEIARRYLREARTANNQHAHVVELAEADLEDLIRRLGLADVEGRLTNAGALLFVATPTVGIDHVRRDHSGGDSVRRIESAGPLIVQVDEVIRAVDGFNRVAHIHTGPGGAVHLRRQALPMTAVREAMVNSVVHRDWHSPESDIGGTNRRHADRVVAGWVHRRDHRGEHHHPPTQASLSLEFPPCAGHLVYAAV